MIRSRELYYKVRYSRRRELCGFIRSFKKYMGGKKHLHVTDCLSRGSVDSIKVEEIPSDVLTDEMVNDILFITDAYSIPRKNVVLLAPDSESGMCSVEVYLYTDIG